MAMIGGLWAAVSWWRRQRYELSSGEQSLSIGEFEHLRKLAKTYPRLDQALKLRVNIVAAGNDDDKAELGAKVDSALRRLAEQVTLRKRIEAALGEIDRDRLAREAAGAKTQAKDAEPDDPVIALAEQLQLQLEQVDRLSERRRALDGAADKIVLLLGNLNLALLEAESTKATEDGDKVSTVLDNLEEAGDLLRRTTEAEEEVARMLKASRGALAQHQ